jgi:hypothetical protein
MHMQPGSQEWLQAKSKGPRWEYEDAAGVPHVGYMQTFTDRGGTDVTYWFRDHVTGELSLVSGSRLKAARRIWDHDDREAQQALSEQEQARQ